MNLNKKCDGNHCLHKEGQVRELPGREKLILCQHCFNNEVRERRRDGVNLPSWNACKVYGAIVRRCEKCDQDATFMVYNKLYCNPHALKACGFREQEMKKL